MKLKSYTLLFRLFSFLSDKTNGASLFVKYKLLLGTLIIGLVSTSACKSKKEEVMCYVQIEEKPLTEKTTCYDSIVVKLDLNTVNIRGTVIDKSGEPIIAASITIKNSTKGTIADLEGKFSINASSKDSLEFSFIGLLPRVISVSELKENNVITMEEDTRILNEEIVVSCYAIQKKE